VLAAIAMNKIEEESILKRFNEAYEKFPNGEILHPDKPDFIITGEKDIGIEITQVFRDQDSLKGSKLRAEETCHRLLGENILRELKELNVQSLAISIHTNIHSDITKANLSQVAKECVPHIINAAPHLENLNFLSIANLGQLPGLIDTLNIVRNDGQTDLIFTESGRSILPQLTTMDVQFVLNKKEIEKTNYTNCDEFWLVIKEGSFIADSFDEIRVNRSELITSFDKIFIIRQPTSEIVELK
jgi:hypothetical protein